MLKLQQHPRHLHVQGKRARHHLSNQNPHYLKKIQKANHQDHKAGAAMNAKKNIALQARNQSEKRSVKKRKKRNVSEKKKEVCLCCSRRNLFQG